MDSRSLVVRTGRGTVRTDRAIRSEKLAPVWTAWAIRSKKLASVWTAWAIRSKKLASVRTARAIRSKKFVSRSNGLSYISVQVSRSNGLSYPFKKKSAFGMVRAVPFKKICQPFQLSVGKNKTLTSSFHWKVKCCEWSLCGDVICQLGSIIYMYRESTEVNTTVHSCENLSSRQVFTSRLIYDDKVFCTTLFTETPLRFYVSQFERLESSSWKLIRSHAVIPRWLDDAKECIQSEWSKQRDCPQHTK